MFSESPIKRRKSTRIYVGDVPIGDGAPIAVQDHVIMSCGSSKSSVASFRLVLLHASGMRVFLKFEH